MRTAKTPTGLPLAEAVGVLFRGFYGFVKEGALTNGRIKTHHTD